MACPHNTEAEAEAEITEPLLHHRMEAQIEAIPTLAAAVDTALTTMPILAYSVNLCLEELVSNTILYGYRGAIGPIEIIICRHEHHLEIHYLDQAPPFNPFTEIPPPNLDLGLEDRTLGGLGIHLVRQMMDQIQSWHTPEGNHICLIKCYADPQHCGTANSLEPRPNNAPKCHMGARS